jgi:hypothetical protein
MSSVSGRPHWQTDAGLLVSLMGTDKRETAMTESYSGFRWRVRGTLLLTLLAGLALLITAPWWPWQFIQTVAAELGDALIIATVLGTTIDQILKTELIRDAFRAAFQYVLPDELKVEVNRVISYRKMIIDTTVVIHLEKLSSNLVKVTVKIEKTVENISKHWEKVFNQLALDEWGLSAGHIASISRCTMTVEGTTYPGLPDPDHNDSGMSVGQKTKTATLKPGARALCVSEGYEIKTINDTLILSFFDPVSQPIVVIHADKGIETGLMFSRPGEPACQSNIEPRTTLNGTLFPGQCIRVRWWPKTSQPSENEM